MARGAALRLPTSGPHAEGHIEGEAAWDRGHLDCPEVPALPLVPETPVPVGPTTLGSPSLDGPASAGPCTFAQWAAGKGMLAINAQVQHVLAFLQDRQDKSLVTSTLRGQLSTISGVLGTGSGSSLAMYPHVRCFM